MTNDWLDSYDYSIREPEKFWGEMAQRLDWIKPWQTVTSGTMQEGNVKWFEEGTLNVTYNCVDRYAYKQPEKAAFIWEGDEPGQSKTMTYRQLYHEVCRFANVLKAMGVQKGDIVCIYMPMILEAPIAMLACARIGAVHSVIFGGFSASSIADRIRDARCRYVITADGGYRGGKLIPLKDNVDKALTSCDCTEKVLVVSHAGNAIQWHESRDIDYQTMYAKVSSDCPPEEVNAEDPLFILYTSGSTGKPKGVVHTSAGYLLFTALTYEKVFDLKANDIYWCSADVGWITGHSYVVYGPLANGSTVVVFEGVPNYPSSSRLFEIVDKHQVSILYTAPTAIRALMVNPEASLGNTSRQSLRLLATVGEPINESAWQWYHDKVGNGQCPVIDTWWQTETGGIMIAPSAYRPQKPGYASYPFLGIEAAIVDKDTGQEKYGEITGDDAGPLVIKKPWPGMMRTLYGDHKRYMQTYFEPYPGYYFPADGAIRDADGAYRIIGRLDDVISIAGHRVGTAEIENAINSHPAISESAVVGIPDELKGEAIYAFIMTKKGQTPSDKLKQEVKQYVKDTYGPIAVIKYIQWVKALPKTRSGKIMRRILRKITHFEENQIGDTTTLADPGCIDDLINNRQNAR